MDSKQFDELVARLASGATRRNAVKGIAGGALASVGISSVASSQGKGRKASAERHKKKKKCKKSEKRQKLEICHNGETITVSKCAWKRAHKHHAGDHKGKCYGG